MVINAAQILMSRCDELALPADNSIIKTDLVDRRLLWFPTGNVLYCPMEYASSDFLLYHFHKREGVNTNVLTNKTTTNLISLAKVYNPIPMDKEELDTITYGSHKLLIVMDPFVRLINAYFNTLSHAKANVPELHKFYKKHGSNSFKYFIQYVLEHEDEDCNWHWCPISLQCHVCDVQFNLVIKDERLESLLGYLGTLVNSQFSDDFSLTPQIKPSVVRSLMDTLTSKQKHQLYKMYNTDFILFDYSILKYVDEELAKKILDDDYDNEYNDYYDTNPEEDDEEGLL